MELLDTETDITDLDVLIHEKVYEFQYTRIGVWRTPKYEKLLVTRD